MDDALHGATTSTLPEVPFIDAGAGGAPAIFDAAPARAMRLLEWGERRYGPTAMRIGDRRSRAWLARSGNPYLAEIDAVAARVGRPGAFASIGAERAAPLTSTGVRSVQAIDRVAGWFGMSSEPPWQENRASCHG